MRLFRVFFGLDDDNGLRDPGIAVPEFGKSWKSEMGGSDSKIAGIDEEESRTAVFAITADSATATYGRTMVSESLAPGFNGCFPATKSSRRK